MSCNSQSSSYGDRGYQSSTVNSTPSSYSKLSSYNRGMQGIQPVLPANTTSGFYVVPDWPHVLSYDTLTKSGENGYASIQSAYGSGAQNCCPRYKKVPCNLNPMYPSCPSQAPQQSCDPENNAPQYMMPVSSCSNDMGYNWSA